MILSSRIQILVLISPSKNHNESHTHTHYDFNPLDKIMELKLFVWLWPCMCMRNEDRISFHFKCFVVDLVVIVVFVAVSKPRYSQDGFLKFISFYSHRLPNHDKQVRIPEHCSYSCKWLF